MLESLNRRFRNGEDIREAAALLRRVAKGTCLPGRSSSDAPWLRSRSRIPLRADCGGLVRIGSAHRLAFYSGIRLARQAGRRAKVSNSERQHGKAVRAASFEPA